MNGTERDRIAIIFLNRNGVNGTERDKQRDETGQNGTKRPYTDGTERDTPPLGGVTVVPSVPFVSVA